MCNAIVLFQLIKLEIIYAFASAYSEPNFPAFQKPVVSVSHVAI